MRTVFNLTLLFAAACGASVEPPRATEIRTPTPAPAVTAPRLARVEVRTSTRGLLGDRSDRFSARASWTGDALPVFDDVEASEGMNPASAHLFFGLEPSPWPAEGDAETRGKALELARCQLRELFAVARTLRSSESRVEVPCSLETSGASIVMVRREQRSCEGEVCTSRLGADTDLTSRFAALDPRMGQSRIEAHSIYEIVSSGDQLDTISVDTTTRIDVPEGFPMPPTESHAELRFVW
jgi:hypothetical protein